MLRTGACTVALLFITAGHVLHSQTESRPEKTPAPGASTKKWYDVLSISGYMQIRYNRLLETNPDLQCEQCDKSWGAGKGFIIRRGRLKLSGNITNRVYFYLQPDFGSAVSSNLHYFQLRDAYFDLGLDKKNEFRLRVGQSKVPFGFENLQSSQNRIPLDRNDAINSAAPNERDLGIFFMYAPAAIRQRFSELIKSGLRGSGDYGVFAFGVYDGQSANKPERNDNRHLVARLSYPFKLRNGQFIEPGLQAYTGRFTLHSTSAGVKGRDDFEYTDQRVAASLVVYPQPFGFQAEYNVGKGPEYNTALNTIEHTTLKGGYIQAHYTGKINDHSLAPFVRYHFFDGGKKHEIDARSYSVREWEIGLEWQPHKNLELNATYTISNRRFEDAVRPINRQTGNLLRLQLQINY